MTRGKLILLIVAAVLVALGTIFVCTAMFSSNKGAPVPASTPVVEETSDCDDEDKAKRDVQDCGIGVLINPGKKTTAPVVKPTTKPAAPKCTPTRTRRC